MGRPTAASLHFHGAIDTVTGSRFELRFGKGRYLVDCGLFQGLKELRLRNWAASGLEAQNLDAVFLTHAHLDHSGYLPVLSREGFTGPIYCTAATRDLCRYLLPDSGFIQEKDAARANRYGYTRHQPALPLYTQAEAAATLAQFQSVDFNQSLSVSDQMQLKFSRAGHIPGAASLQVSLGKLNVLFSGDLGRSNCPTMPPPDPPPAADYVVIESTYGDRLHNNEDVEVELAALVRDTLARGGTMVVPAFAVGRTQLLLHHLCRLMRSRQIPRVPVFLDSPLGINATEVFANHPDDHRLSLAEAEAACALPRYVRDPEESRRLDHDPMPKIILAGSGMATGGRVLHHLKVYLGDQRHTVLLTGYQAAGTRGAKLIQSAESIRIHGQDWPVRAQIAHLDSLSAHADSDELIEWLSQLPRAPRKVFVVHGETQAAGTLAERIQSELCWPACCPESDHPYPLAPRG